MDVFLYSGSIERGYDLRFVNEVANNKASKTCLVIMTSGGGSPDAAYKMARYLQYKYEHYNVLVAGICKSAATLFAIGAKEIVFCPFGELGPLDIQLQKEDKIAGQESGLNISEAFSSLEVQATNTFNTLLVDIIKNSGGVVSFKTASDVAIGMVSSLYGPIFSQIEPEEVGSRTRAMRIGEDYAKRLNIGNLKNGALNQLSTHYASHSFVIDFHEAKTLFNSVRLVNEEESKIIDEIGQNSRFPTESVLIKKIDTSSKVVRNDTKPVKRKSSKKSKARSTKRTNRASSALNGSA